MLNHISHSNFKIRYKPEIDGLRAFAVTAVIIKKFKKDIFSNGYLELNIFASSGYVICFSIAKSKSKNF